MADIVDKTTRSKIMSQVRSTNTKPELIIRKGLYEQGFRYRLYRTDLPGKPDLCLAKYKAVIFIHGCQWHWHGCPRSRMPATNIDYWKNKIERNIIRDRQHIQQLLNKEWRILIIWECAIKKSLLTQTLLLTQQWLCNGNLRYNQIEPLNKREVLLTEAKLLSDDDF
ncbi:DNA mismatch endonuclease Vsr [Salmonella enterica subsp. enterica serovar Carmel]|uniref:DNA mismatch endonuclease Vsr n=1 Tax=Salmonella enterica TaxID=28901 RepID=A0A743BDK5_SALER|nr:very short patch repair endonuclease [Salmonella enterica subsp. enterica serovar Carmel]EBW4675917.1 very short patch repair endonuclease [Salmonella enterica subsp. salamae serovar Sofia]EDP8967057.1 DNA mismatch endonuclease Vsr [Salmonella enterica subsp. enterica]EED7473269.1 DNA mismatch endonuclease Vsr [Salmonella enterica subsp. salamae]HAF1734840.1 DNA mismatch endonuclease Vsr [Salmonella enterica]